MEFRYDFSSEGNLQGRKLNLSHLCLGRRHEIYMTSTSCNRDLFKNKKYKTHLQMALQRENVEQVLHKYFVVLNSLEQGVSNVFENERVN